VFDRQESRHDRGVHSTVPPGTASLWGSQWPTREILVWQAQGGHS